VVGATLPALVALRQAIKTTLVAAARHRDAQVVNSTSKGVHVFD